MDDERPPDDALVAGKGGHPIVHDHHREAVLVCESVRVVAGAGKGYTARRESEQPEGDEDCAQPDVFTGTGLPCQGLCSAGKQCELPRVSRRFRERCVSRRENVEVGRAPAKMLPRSPTWRMRSQGAPWAQFVGLKWAPVDMQPLVVSPYWCTCMPW